MKYTLPNIFMPDTTLSGRMAFAPDAIGKKQLALRNAMQELQALGNPEEAGEDPGKYTHFQNRIRGNQERGEIKNKVSGDVKVTKYFKKGAKADIAAAAKELMAKHNKPHQEWKAKDKAYKAYEKAKAKAEKLQGELSTLQAESSAEMGTAQRELAQDVLTDPMKAVTTADVAKVDPKAAGTNIGATVGQVATGRKTPTYAAKTATTTEAEAPEDIDTETYKATTATKGVKKALRGLDAAEGEVSEEAQVTAAEGEVSEGAIADAANFDPDYMQSVTAGQRDVSADELAQAQGLDEEAVKTKIAQTNVPENIKAAQTRVKGRELPQPAQIKNSEMAQADAMTMEGLTDDAQVTAAKLERFSVDDGTLAAFKEGKIEAQDTVQGQLSQLMKDFDDGTPAWAAGAMRAANAAMAARGLGASSMAGAAIVQAAMESAIPIASQDAEAFRTMKMDNLNRQQQVALTNAAAQQGVELAKFNAEQQAALQNSQNAFSLQGQNLSNMQQAVLATAQIKASLQGQNLTNAQQSNLAIAARYAEASNLNLSNRQQALLQDNQNALQVNLENLSAKQQAYVANAQLEAALQGKKIDNQQQAAIANAARFAEANNLTFNAQQQAQLHNSELMKSIGLANLNAKQAATLQNAATIASMDMANLSNAQQAAVQNAQAFLQMDMQNLSNEQQTAMFKAQAIQQSILSDQAASNAAKQFNAASENETNQFMAELQSQTAQFNAAQANANSQFNAGQVNAARQFNAEMKNQREQFNATNSLIVAQANAQWRQTVATTNTAAQNQANLEAAKTANAYTAAQLDEIWQRERDMLSMAWKSSESAADRANNIVLTQMSIDAKEEALALQRKAEKDSAIGGFIGTMIYGGLTGAFKI